MNEEDRKIITRNKLAMRRLSLIENYMGTMTSINRMMSDLCLNLAKAKYEIFTSNGT